MFKSQLVGCWVLRRITVGCWCRSQLAWLRILWFFVIFTGKFTTAIFISALTLICLSDIHVTGVETLFCVVVMLQVSVYSSLMFCEWRYESIVSILFHVYTCVHMNFCTLRHNVFKEFLGIFNSYYLKGNYCKCFAENYVEVACICVNIYLLNILYFN